MVLRSGFLVGLGVGEVVGLGVGLIDGMGLALGIGSREGATGGDGGIPGEEVGELVGEGNDSSIWSDLAADMAFLESFSLIMNMPMIIIKMLIIPINSLSFLLKGFSNMFAFRFTI